jgi:hypothetical protein
MPSQICKKDHSDVLTVLENLPDSQTVIKGRHKCAGCAYDEGFKAGWKAAGAKPPSGDDFQRIRLG